MKKILLRTLCAILIIALLFAALPGALSLAAPEYRDAVGDASADQKIQGLYLVKESAKRKDNVIIYGSSELQTDYISTHPANFFKDKRAGFQVNLVGMGSCQSIIHALSIAASGDSLKDTPVVLITSPQSYVEGGITSDMFFKNFSPQQYVTIMYDKSIPDDIKVYFSKRVCEMIELDTTGQFKKISCYKSIEMLAKLGAEGNFLSNAAKIGCAPYFLFIKYLEDNKDVLKSIELINSAKEDSAAKIEEIDYKKEEQAAVEIAKTQTDNNDFGMRNDDWKINVGSDLKQFKDDDINLSYDNSVEYDDLRLLLDICELKGIKPMFVSVPLHGKWSDYTGFKEERRQSYYEKVESIVSEYDTEFVDLSGYEYEEYFLCDTMHLGWKGWLKVNEEIDSFYKRFRQ